MARRLALALCAGTLFPLFAVACGSGDSNSSNDPGSSTNSPAAGATQSSSNPSGEPQIAMPASRFAISVDDMGKDATTGNAAYLTDLKATYVLDAKSYGRTSAFASADEGEKLLTQWGYLGGYETGLIPEGRDTAVLNGAYYVNVEVHLFKSSDGAKKAYEQFDKKVRGAGKGQEVPSATIGNQSNTWTLTEGKVGTSTVNRVYHQAIFRRGNLVAAILTSGAEGFMKVDIVRAMAAIVDQKAIGQKNAVEPTPVPTSAAPTSPTRQP